MIMLIDVAEEKQACQVNLESGEVSRQTARCVAGCTVFGECHLHMSDVSKQRLDEDQLLVHVREASDNLSDVGGSRIDS